MKFSKVHLPEPGEEQPHAPVNVWADWGEKSLAEKDLRVPS